MERLTKKNKHGEAYFPYCFREDTCAGNGSGDCASCEFMEKTCNTLAKYDDMMSATDTESMKMDFDAMANDILEYVCDNRCKIPVDTEYTQDDVDEICSKCGFAKRVKSLKDAHMKFCDNVDKLYLEKCMEVNKLSEIIGDVSISNDYRLAGSQTEIRLQEAADEI